MLELPSTLSLHRARYGQVDRHAGAVARPAQFSDAVHRDSERRARGLLPSVYLGSKSSNIIEPGRIATLELARPGVVAIAEVGGQILLGH